MATIDLGKSVYELTKKHPELVGILAELGFPIIRNPIARKSIGRTTTIPNACKTKGKNLNEIIKRLKKKGFDVIN